MIYVRVPATSANMGSGFDTLGVALNLYSRLEVEERESGLEIITVNNAGNVQSDRSNLVYRAMDRIFRETGYKPQGLYIKQDSKIPMTRGLGSSSACIIGGMLAANIISGRKLSYSEILSLAAEMEGHPDNVGPALYGGLCISATEGRKTIVKSEKLDSNLKFAVMIPNFYVATKKSRGTLPELIHLRDAADNISSALILHEALVTGDYDMLRFGVRDKLHQPYRKGYIDGFDEIFDKTYDCGSKATYLSGSGPTIISILTGESTEFRQRMESFFRENSHGWKCMLLEADNVGSVVSVR
ncbi:MAG: homoserine kinase [Candidatus Ornithomonoglobus sp.]